MIELSNADQDRSARDAPDTAGERRGATDRDVYTVANVVTVVRLLLIPFFFWALVSSAPGSDTLAFWLFAVAASTDFLDGLIARRTGTVTAIGRVIDPAVDRLLIAAALVGLHMVDRLPLWIVLVLVLRDVYLLYGSWVLEKQHLRLEVTNLGKATTMVLLFGFASLVWGWPVVEIPGAGATILGSLVVYVGAALSLTAAVHYTVRARAAVAGAKGS